MTRTAAVFALAAPLALASVVAIACGASRDRDVELSGAWPDRPDDYKEVTERWTRSDRVRADIDEHLSEIVRAHATLLAPEWRAAYVQKRAEAEELSDARRRALLASQRERDEAYYEVMLIARAYERRLLDFDRGDDSVWTVALSDGRGREVEATQIERDRRLPSIIAEFFPFMGDFDEAFLIRFPREGDVDLFGEGAERAELSLASPRATVTLTWAE